MWVLSTVTWDEAPVFPFPDAVDTIYAALRTLARDLRTSKRAYDNVSLTLIYNAHLYGLRKARATDLLPELHDLEALEVGELPPLLELSTFLGPAALCPLLLNLMLLPLLCDKATSGGAGQLGNDNRGEGHLGEGDGLARHGGVLGGTVDKHLISSERRTRTGIAITPYTLVVDDLNDGGYPSIVLAAAEDDDAADLDQPPGARCDISVTHFDGMCCN